MRVLRLRLAQNAPAFAQDDGGAFVANSGDGVLVPEFRLQCQLASGDVLSLESRTAIANFLIVEFCGYVYTRRSAVLAIYCDTFW